MSTKKTVSKVAGRGAAPSECAETRPGRKRHKIAEHMAAKLADPKLNATPVLLIKNVFAAQIEPQSADSATPASPEKRGRGRPRSVGVGTPVGRVGGNLIVQPVAGSDSAAKKGQPRKSKAAAANAWLPMTGKSRVGGRSENGVDRSTADDDVPDAGEAGTSSDATPVDSTPTKRKRGQGRPTLKSNQAKSKSLGGTPKASPKPKPCAPKPKLEEVSEDEEEVKKPEEVVETGAVGRRARQLKSRKSLGDDFIELKLKHIRRACQESDADSDAEARNKNAKKRRIEEEVETEEDGDEEEEEEEGVDDDEDSDADEMANGEEMSDEEMLEKDMMKDKKVDDQIRDEIVQDTNADVEKEMGHSGKVTLDTEKENKKVDTREVIRDIKSDEVPPKKEQASTVITLTKQGATPTKSEVPKMSSTQKVLALPQLGVSKNVAIAPKSDSDVVTASPIIMKGRSRGRPKMKLAAASKPVAPQITTSLKRQSARERAEFPQQQAPKLTIPLPLKELLASVNRSDAPELRTLYMFQSAERNGWLKIVYKRLRHLAAVPVGSMAACQYQCPFCPHRAVLPRDVADHLHMRHPSLAAIAEGKCTRVFTTFLFMFCRHCDYVAYEKLALWYHFDHFHGVPDMLASRYRGANYADVALPELSPAVLSSARTLLCCRQCQFYSVNKQFAVLHTLRMHPEKEGTSGFVTLKQLDAIIDVDDDTGKVPREAVGGRTMLTRDCFVCNECLFIAYKRALVELHCINTHARRVLLFVCSLCSTFQCTAAYQMSEHVAAMHPDARRQVCSVTLVNNGGVEDPCLCSVDTRDGDKRMESWPAITEQKPQIQQPIRKEEDEVEKDDKDDDDDEFARAIANAVPDDDDEPQSVMSEAEAQEELLALAAQAAAAHPEHAIPHTRQIEPLLVVKNDDLNRSHGLIQMPVVGIQTSMANIQTPHITAPMPVIQTPIAAMQTPVTAIHTPIQTPVASAQTPAAAMHTPVRHNQGAIQIPNEVQTMQPTSILRPALASEAAHTSVLQATNADVPVTGMSAGSVVHADELAERLAQREPDTVSTGGASAEQLEMLAEAARTGQLSGAGLHAIQGPDGSITYVQLVFEDEGGAGDATNTGDDCQMQLAVDADGNYQLVQMVEEPASAPADVMEQAHSVVEPVAQMLPEPVTESVVAHINEGLVEEPTVQQLVESATEPITQPVTPMVSSGEHAVESAIDPLIQPTVEPVAHIAEPIQEPPEQHVAEPIYDPVAQQHVAEPIHEPMVQHVAEPIQEPIVHVAEPIYEPAVLHITEPNQELLTEAMPAALAQPMQETEAALDPAVAVPAEEQSKQVILQYTVGDETVYLCCDQDMLFAPDGTMQLDAASLLPAAEAAVAAAGAAPPGQDRIFYLQNETAATPAAPAPQPPARQPQVQRMRQPQAPAVRQQRQRTSTPRMRQPGPRANAGRSIVRQQRQQTYIVQHPAPGRGQQIVTSQQSLLTSSANKAVEPGSYESVFQSFCNTGNIPGNL